jgi:hypothetical protein
MAAAFENVKRPSSLEGVRFVESTPGGLTDPMLRLNTVTQSPRGVTDPMLAIKQCFYCTPGMGLGKAVKTATTMASDITGGGLPLALVMEQNAKAKNEKDKNGGEISVA